MRVQAKNRWLLRIPKGQKTTPEEATSKPNCLLLLLYLTVKGLTNPRRLPSTMYLKKLCASVKNDTINFSKKVTRGGLQRRKDAEHASTLVSHFASRLSSILLPFLLDQIQIRHFTIDFLLCPVD
jgi:hypothetical protein